MAKRRRLPEDEGKQRAKNEHEDDSLDEEEEDATTSSDDDGSSSAPEVSTDDGGGGSDSDGDGGSSGELDEVNVNFEFFDPLEGDFHGLKALLGAYLDGEVYDISGLADAIIAQNTVGTVVKTGEDDDPIAVMTALNTRRYAAAEWMRAARDFVLRRAARADGGGGDTGGGAGPSGSGSGGSGGSGGGALAATFAKAWDAEGTALLINERLINAPPSLAPPLVQALFDEIAWATEDEPTPERRAAFKLERFVVVARVYGDPDSADDAGDDGSDDDDGSSSDDDDDGDKQTKKKQKLKKKKKKKAKRSGKGQGQQQPRPPAIVYVRPEDEYFHAVASASFTWPVEGRAVAKDELRPMRLAMVVTAAAAARARKELDRVVGNAAAMMPPPPALPPGGGKGAKAAAAGSKK